MLFSITLIIITAFQLATVIMVNPNNTVVILNVKDNQTGL